MIIYGKKCICYCQSRKPIIVEKNRENWHSVLFVCYKFETIYKKTIFTNLIKTMGTLADYWLANLNVNIYNIDNFQLWYYIVYVTNRIYSIVIYFKNSVVQIYYRSQCFCSWYNSIYDVVFYDDGLILAIIPTFLDGKFESCL